jgi:diguanylate cyclase (GGDEF)-like protein
VFTDLALWMVGLGVAIGMAFPFVMILLGVPSRFTLTPPFFAACVVAGAALAALNNVLARRVVGVRLGALTQRMRYVADVIEEATFSGDWARCSPSECSLPVESDDQLGEAAASFNQLIWSLSTSREVQQATADMGKTMSAHLELDDFCPSALRAWVHHGTAGAGALCVVRDGELEVAAVERLEAPGLDRNPAVVAALSAGEPVVVNVPGDVSIDAALVTFRPTCIMVIPLRFRAVPLGVMVLAFEARPLPERLRLLASFADPMSVALNNVLTHERFQRLAAVDPLTGAYNRRFGLQRLAEEWARSRRADGPLGILSFDIDHFKAVNDDHGHLVGDRVLREVAATARQALRDGDVLIRTGGEEFLVVLPGAGPTDVEAIGERIRRVIASTVVPSRNSAIQVTVSLGGACAPHEACPTIEDLQSTADDALYSAKRGGRDRLVMARGVHQRQ